MFVSGCREKAVTVKCTCSVFLPHWTSKRDCAAGRQSRWRKRKDSATDGAAGKKKRTSFAISLKQQIAVTNSNNGRLPKKFILAGYLQPIMIDRNRVSGRWCSWNGDGGS